MIKLHRTTTLALALILASVLAGGCSAVPTTEQPTATPIPPTDTRIPPAATLTPPAATAGLPAATVTPSLTDTPVPTLTLTVPPTPSASGVRITIVYDNFASDSSLRASWGFAALLEIGDHTLLFDTGGDGPTLLDNMAKLNLDAQAIEAVILSHNHDDHIGGLRDLLDTGVSPTVYVPAAFPPSFKDSVRARTDLIEVTGPLEILPGVHSTGQLHPAFAEQALVVETGEGAAVVTGCAHPGIARMVRQAQEVVGGQVALVVGGFHLIDASPSQIQRIFADFRQLGVQQVSPTHCTGREPVAIFADEYGDGYIAGGVGRVMVVGPAPHTTMPQFDSVQSAPRFAVPWFGRRQLCSPLTGARSDPPT